MSTHKRLALILMLAFAVAVVYALGRDRAVAPPAGGVGGSSAASTAAVTPAAVVAGDVSPTQAAATKGHTIVAVALPRLVDVGADKCIPCKAMAPILEELRVEYAGQLRVDFIDAWKYPERAEPFNVYGIPAQIFFDSSGRELYRHVGFISKADILATWRRLGYPLTPREKK